MLTREHVASKLRTYHLTLSPSGELYDWYWTHGVIFKKLKHISIHFNPLPEAETTIVAMEEMVILPVSLIGRRTYIFIRLSSHHLVS